MDATGAVKAVVISALLFVALAGLAAADDLAGSASSYSSSGVERDRLYAELAEDVQEIELRGSIVKRVVKLATPAVVHIEARKEVENARPARGESEEAGSGVIIERRGRLFV